MAAIVDAERTNAPSIPLPDEVNSDVVVFPQEVEPDGRGLYHDTVVTIAKEFRAEGVSATYQHDQDARTWVGEKAATEVVLALVIGIASNAGWAALCRILRRQYDSDRVRVRVGRFRKTASEVSWEWYQLDGRGEEVARALAAIEAPTDEAARVEQEEEQEAAKALE